MIDENGVFEDLYTAGQNAPLTGSEHTVQWVVPESLPYLSGHFPGSPVMPAVGLIDASLVLVRGILANPRLELREVPNAKFLAPLVPGTRVLIRTQFGQEGRCNVTWSGLSSVETVSPIFVSVDLQFSEQKLL